MVTLWKIQKLIIQVHVKIHMLLKQKEELTWAFIEPSCDIYNVDGHTS